MLILRHIQPAWPQQRHAIPSGLRLAGPSFIFNRTMIPMTLPGYVRAIWPRKREWLNAPSQWPDHSRWAGMRWTTVWRGNSSFGAVGKPFDHLWMRSLEKLVLTAVDSFSFNSTQQFIDTVLDSSNITRASIVNVNVHVDKLQGDILRSPGCTVWPHLSEGVINACETEVSWEADANMS